METKSNNNNEQENKFNYRTDNYIFNIDSVFNIEESIKSFCGAIENDLKNNLSVDYHLEFTCSDDEYEDDEDNLEMNLSISAMSLGNYNDSAKSKNNATMYPIFNSAPVPKYLEDCSPCPLCYCSKDTSLYLYCVTIENINKISALSTIVSRIIYLDTLKLNEYLSKIFLLCIGSSCRNFSNINKKYKVDGILLNNKRDDIYMAMNQCIKDDYNYGENFIMYTIRPKDMDKMKLSILSDINDIDFDDHLQVCVNYNLIYESFRMIIEFYIESKPWTHGMGKTSPEFIGVKIASINYDGEDTKCDIRAYKCDDDVDCVIQNILSHEIDSFIDKCTKPDGNLDSDIYVNMNISDLKVTRYNDFVNTERIALRDYTSDEIIAAMNEYDLKDIFASIINKAKEKDSKK